MANIRPIPTLFIVLEGLDGAGKSTIARLLRARLQRTGRPSVLLSTPPPPFLHLKDGVIREGSLLTRFLFFLASVSHASDMAEKALSSHSVVCDRYLYSTLAYHRALGLDIEKVHAERLPILEPDIAFLLDVDETERVRRIERRKNSTAEDRTTYRDLTLSSRLRTELERFDLVRVDTTGSTPEEVTNDAMKVVDRA